MTRPKGASPIEPKEPKPGAFTHLLLPGDGERPAPRVLRFYVTRKDAKTGRWEYAPQAFGAGDLANPEALFQAYGGGEYWIRGQDDSGFVAPFGVWTLAGAPRPLAPEPEHDTAPPPPPMPAGPLDLGALLMMQFQAQQQQQAENTRLMGTIITAVLTQRPPSAGDGLSTRLLEALVAKGSPSESGEMLRQTQSAWKEGLGHGTELAKIAAEAREANGAAPEPSGLDKALDSIAPMALGRMVDKVLA